VPEGGSWAGVKNETWLFVRYLVLSSKASQCGKRTPGAGLLGITAGASCPCFWGIAWWEDISGINSMVGNMRQKMSERKREIFNGGASTYSSVMGRWRHSKEMD
jgi:hypothetical protein